MEHTENEDFRAQLLQVLSEFIPREYLEPASAEDWKRLHKVYQCAKERNPKLKELDLLDPT